MAVVTASQPPGLARSTQSLVAPIQAAPRRTLLLSRRASLRLPEPISRTVACGCRLRGGAAMPIRSRICFLHGAALVSPATPRDQIGHSVRV